MNVRIVSYTVRGEATARRVSEILRGSGHGCRRFALEKFCRDGDEPLSGSAVEWARDGFLAADALIFVCASGIAVRAIAPWVKDKTTDPAVLVLDETARFVIPLLSGHAGGANALAEALADALSATAVVTTATDVNGRFAVDVFAKNNCLVLTDGALAKTVSAAILNGEPVGFRSELPVSGPLPEGLSDDAALGVYVGTGASPFSRTLRLIPRRFALGVGCRRGKDADALRSFVERTLARHGVLKEELRCVASIDLKKDEPGLLALSDALGVPFLTYSAEELSAVPGEFIASAFVRETTGVDSVAERAAVKASGGTLVVRKTAEDGMTFALASYEEELRFA
ncbi:MAG: cobalt-precorrin 5A hydrolase [Clostridia bacterium]|nr:cobalt-precorrin 5A hydrolase [Clostridia bacterium]